MAKSKAKTAATLSGARERPTTSFVDAHGGALATLAAGIARRSDASAARREALAATTSQAVDVPSEIAAVLAEIGASAPPVVLASALPAGVERVDVGTWGLALHAGEGDLERLALARIARDRIERRLEADGAASPR